MSESYGAAAPALPTTVSVARYRFAARVLDPLRLPHYAGSLLRGQFGAALRQLACMTRQPSCAGCPLQATCPYARIFDTPPPAAHRLQRFSAIPKPYVLEPPAPDPAGASRPLLEPGQDLVFHMVLVGHALQQLPLVIQAWRRALERGLTRQRSRAELLRVTHVPPHGAHKLLWYPGANRLPMHDPQLELPAFPPVQSIRLHWHAPLRLQSQGRPLGPDRVDERRLIAAVARRAALLLEFHAGQPQWGLHVPAAAEQAGHLRGKRRLQWMDWKRYSSRQHRSMALGGVLGQWQLHGPPESLAVTWPWLWLGQWLHAGKNATFGMGGYTLQAGSLPAPGQHKSECSAKIHNALDKSLIIKENLSQAV